MNRKAFIAWILVFFSMSAVLFGGGIPSGERAALIALYNSTNGDSWTNKSGWKTPPLHSDGFAMPGTEESWYGVDLTSGRVTRLYLYYNNLVGSLPDQLSNLTRLTYLSLWGNKLTGNIPSSLGSLLYLENLRLSDNQFSSSIPSELGSLSSLEELDLADNQLSGGIPYQLGNLGNLENLTIYLNQLSGSIPSQIGNLSKLKHFSIWRNKLMGTIPSSLTQLTSITYLDISYNCLSASDPALVSWLNAHDSNWASTQTECGGLSAPTVTTNAVTSITTVGAACGGAITSDGGASVSGKGVCWNTSPNPLTSHSKTYDGMGIGSFTSAITGLSPNTTYYVRAYAYNVVGTSYGPQVAFTTLGNLPEKNPPFGEFATPVTGASVAGSIPVTGWALDDSGVSGVKIYRTEGKSQVLIGEASFVEGARPDVALAYPEYPNNTRAGWGYMMLTNFLPNQGNGTYEIVAVARDSAGKTTTLGKKTIYVDNAHAVKPFGAIDTPAQGGTASGNKFINWGWALTPPPNTIPASGATINVWIDGADKGHPNYNNYRPDIAGLFPGYNNSNNASGYYQIDTTQYSNGVHTIAWSVADNVGNADGVGSRYFSISNSEREAFSAQNAAAPIPAEAEIDAMPCWLPAPVQYRVGFSTDGEWREKPLNDDGGVRLAIRELERIEIRLGDGETMNRGYQLLNGKVHSLPVGSSLDPETGAFCWAPGPGFLGSYELLFILADSNGQSYKQRIDIVVLPLNESKKIKK